MEVLEIMGVYLGNISLDIRVREGFLGFEEWVGMSEVKSCSKERLLVEGCVYV